MKTILLLLLCATPALAQETYDYTASLIGTWTPLNGDAAQDITATVNEQLSVLGPASNPAEIGFNIAVQTSNGYLYTIDAPHCDVFAGCGGIYGQGSAQIFATNGVIASQQTSYLMNDPTTGGQIVAQLGKGGDAFSLNPGCCSTSDGVISLSDIGQNLKGALIHQAPELSGDDALSALTLLGICVLIYLSKHNRGSKL